MKKYYVFAVLLILVAVAAAAAHALISSPRVDDQTASEDIRVLIEDVQQYVTDHNQLPDTLADLGVKDAQLKSRFAHYDYSALPSPAPSDPQDTSRQLNFQVCHVFLTDTTATQHGVSSDIYISRPEVHAKGRDCIKGQAYATQPISPHPTIIPFKVTPSPSVSPKPASSKS
jgi:type II secretory pathway pseudopilin PulG